MHDAPHDQPRPELIQAEEVGLSSERLARIDRHLRQGYLEPQKIAGALTLVARHGKVAYLSPLGRMDLERKKAMHRDTVFRIYSMTKPITSVAMMMLYEEGHFQLNDPVHKFIPEWRGLRVYSSGNYPNFATTRPQRPMTVHHLLTHMSGLTYGFQERTNVDAAYRRLDVGGSGAGGTLKAMIEKLATLPLEFSPGTRWNYSVSTDVLGYLVEVMSGQPLDQFFKEQIFEPLGMVDTGFTVPPQELERFAANYRRAANKTLELEDDPHRSPYLSRRAFLSGGGGLVSTAWDYFRFCQMLLNGGELDGARLLGRKTVELMTLNHLPAPAHGTSRNGGADLTELSVGTFGETTYEGIGFGLGFWVNLDPARSQAIGSAGEYGWGGAASTVFWIDPVEQLIVIFMTQFMPSGTFNFRGQLKSLIYPALVD